MIYTVTFNPSLDYTIRIKNFEVGTLNRTNYEEIRVGGKGVNVSIVLTSLGVENIALGFIAGFTGDQIESGMQQLGCKTEFIRLPQGFSRINIKLRDETETEMNGMGPAVSISECERFMMNIKRLKPGDTLVLSGSIPSSMPQDMYEQILDAVDTDKIRVVVDTSSNLLRRTLAYHPFLIKPNLIELGELFGRSLIDYDDIVGCAKHLQEEGARNVLVSMGSAGAILVTDEGQVFSAPAPSGDLVDSIGAGDAMVAGFLAGYLERNSMVDGFAKGLAAGSATAYKQGLATREEIIAAAKKARAHSFITRLPQGYDTPITEDGGNISQGQRQLLCIARVMLRRPPILILDEATSSIDTRTEVLVQDAFEELMKGRTSFIVAHRLSTIKNADQILVMKAGNIIEQGTHEELLARNGFYANLYRSQFAPA